MNRYFIFRIIAALVLLGAIIGLGAYAYQAGLSQGLASNVQVSTTDNPQGLYPYYGMPFRPFFFGFPGFGFLGCLIPLFLVLLAFAALRGLFGFRHYGWRHMHHGPWGMPPMDQSGEHGKAVPPFFEEWHRRSHESPASTGDKS